MPTVPQTRTSTDRQRSSDEMRKAPAELISSITDLGRRYAAAPIALLPVLTQQPELWIGRLQAITVPVNPFGRQVLSDASGIPIENRWKVNTTEPMTTKTTTRNKAADGQADFHGANCLPTRLRRLVQGMSNEQVERLARSLIREGLVLYAHVQSSPERPSPDPLFLGN